MGATVGQAMGDRPAFGRAGIAAALAAAVAATYWPTGSAPFAVADDALYVFRNPVVLEGITARGVAWAFTSFHAANWHPLAWLSHMLDVSLFGPDPAWHHRVGVALHAAASVLLFLALEGLTGARWRSAFAAALFALHPLHVESVAWVAERKDVLSALFSFAALGAYGRYARDPSPGRYGAVAGLFAMALLSKPMAVTLPFVLLLLDRWPLGRVAPGGAATAGGWVRAWLPLVREKAPLLALSAASCAVTFLAQARGGAVIATDRVGLPLRLANGAVSYVKYAALAAFPAGLSPYHPFPALGIPPWQVAGSALLLAAATAWTWRGTARRPWLLVGWLWYLGTLVPVIGLVQVGGQAMADRYTYVPLVGLFAAVAWGVPEALGDGPLRRRALAGAALAVLALLAVAARGQATLRADDRALYGRAVEEEPGNWMAWNLLGLARGHGGDAPGALAAFRESVRLNPAFGEAWMNLGVALERTGSPAEAVGAYREALRLAPSLEGARQRLEILGAGGS